MFRSYFVLGLQLLVILKLGSADQLETSKSLQKCQDYSKQVYGDATPTCGSSSVGQVLDIQNFPSIALIGALHDDESITFICHGTLVSSRYVLTIAHCLTSARNMPNIVRLGATSYGSDRYSNSSDYDIDGFFVHPLYSPNNYYNHIGLIKLAKKVTFSTSVRPICLPDSDLVSDSLFQTNYEIIKSKPSEQRPLTNYAYNFVTKEKCNELYQEFANRKIRKGITNDLMCATRTTEGSPGYSCIGESGAPLYIDYSKVACSRVQLGVASFGATCDTQTPGVASKLAYFVDWIESEIWAEGEDD